MLLQKLFPPQFKFVFTLVPNVDRKQFKQTFVTLFSNCFKFLGFWWSKFTMEV